jgi:hypothetical protein
MKSVCNFADHANLGRPVVVSVLKYELVFAELNLVLKDGDSDV